MYAVCSRSPTQVVSEKELKLEETSSRALVFYNSMAIKPLLWKLSSPNAFLSHLFLDSLLLLGQG